MRRRDDALGRLTSVSRRRSPSPRSPRWARSASTWPRPSRGIPPPRADPWPVREQQRPAAPRVARAARAAAAATRALGGTLDTGADAVATSVDSRAGILGSAPDHQRSQLMRRVPTSAPKALVYRTRALGTVAELEVTDPSALRGRLGAPHRSSNASTGWRTDSAPTPSCLRSTPRQAAKRPSARDLFEAGRLPWRWPRPPVGLVDPTVGAAMHRLGYDRDFAEVRVGVAGTLPAPRGPCPGWRSVLIDHRALHPDPPARAPALDLGATAKALAADRAAAPSATSSGAACSVSLGGDVAVGGPATRGRLRGRCRRHGAPRLSRPRGRPPFGWAGVLGDRCAAAGASGRPDVHHIVDPRTGLPAATCWRTATVAASSCVEANAASTAAVVRGITALAWLEDLGLPARLVGLDGSVICTSPWPRSADDPRAPRCA